MAWGNSPVRKFETWRTQARETLLDCMQNFPPAPADYAMEVIATEQRNGYKAQKYYLMYRNGAASPPIC